MGKLQKTLPVQVENYIVSNSIPKWSVRKIQDEPFLTHNNSATEQLYEG